MQSALRKSLVPSKAVARLGVSSLLLRHQPPLQREPAAGTVRRHGDTAVCLPHRSVIGTSPPTAVSFVLGAQQQPFRARRRPCDVFINHRGADTKRTVAALLYDRLAQHNVRPFLDNRSMKPGDKLFDTINSAILDCKVGIAIFSPRYWESYFCLHELSLMVDWNKKVIPIFCDVEPADLLRVEVGQHPAEDVERFRRALREVKYTVGLTFDSQNGNWSDLVSKTSEIVLKSIKDETGEEEN